MLNGILLFVFCDYDYHHRGAVFVPYNHDYDYFNVFGIILELDRLKS